MKFTSKNLAFIFLFLTLGFHSYPVQGKQETTGRSSNTPPPLCTQIENGLPNGLTLPGIMVLEWSDVTGRASNPTLYDPATRQMKWVLNPHGADLQNLAVSPDSRWVAYIEDLNDIKGHVRTRILRVINAQQKKQKFDWVYDWQSIIGWVNNQQLAISVAGQESGTITILNPFTGARQKLTPGFPDPLKIDIDKSVFIDSYTMGSKEYFNFGMNQVVYKADSQKLTLWDIPSKKIVWDTEKIVNRTPKWSPDGKGFAAIFSGSDLFYIDRNGQKINLLHLKSSPSFTDPVIGSFTWSPNSNQLALWKQSSSENKLSVIDLQSGSEFQTCISEEYGFGTEPVWSPDSRFVMIDVRNMNYSWTNKIYSYLVILDTINHHAYKILPNAIPIGWLVSP